MHIPQLRMDQTYAQLGLHIQKPVQEIQQPQADLNMKQEPAILTIRQPKGELSIDTTEARSNIDMRSPARRVKDIAAFGHRKAMEAIARISREGDQLAAIEKKGNPIADIAVQNSGIYEEQEILAKGSLIGDGVEIHYEAKKPEINVQVRGFRMDPEIKKPILHYTPGKVEPYILQKNSLHIEVVGLHIDQKR
ncbi:DUF6470 family protein [Brevibacillus fulvus]|uniref:Uncharacterized protein n=1 Tax=Brevibacillus fulvus TaxID=1125967 RepID=A0A938Y5A5_9BACL|nr:DUF6470 family protein [Brevibacillus fulvus]MBM7591505.1 hypothetical protein [Brevibacillus fulvus]